MTASAVLLIVGPCLITGLVAFSLCVASSLGSRRHALYWAVAFLVSALHWGLLATHPRVGQGSGGGAAALDLLGLGGAAFYAHGFSVRRHSLAGTGRVLVAAILTGAAILCLALVWPDAALRTIAIPMIEAALFLWSAFALIVPDRRPSPPEWAMGTSLVAIVGYDLAYVAMSAAGMDRSAMLGMDPIAAVALMAGPGTAAAGLFTLLLIAGDFAAESRKLVHTDPLTGLLNRLGLAHVMATAARPGWMGRRRPIAIAIADIDHFKAINDRYGHAGGDAVLATFADRLADSLRTGEAVARIGGEEFALLLADRSAGEAWRRVEDIRRSLAQLRFEAAPGLRLTASFGVASMAPEEKMEHAMARADEAMYRSKREGRDRATLAPVTADA